MFSSDKGFFNIDSDVRILQKNYQTTENWGLDKHGFIFFHRRNERMNDRWKEERKKGKKEYEREGKKWKKTKKRWIFLLFQS